MAKKPLRARPRISLNAHTAALHKLVGAGAYTPSEAIEARAFFYRVTKPRPKRAA